MKLRIGAVAVFCFGLLIWAVPASAGGWASVKLDSAPGQVYAGTPVSIGFLVLQHDVTPLTVDRAYLEATNRETGEELNVDAHHDGDVGHFMVDVTFPSAGPWKWKITPEPFEGTSFATLNVLPTSTSANLSPEGFPEPFVHPAAIRIGNCQQDIDDVFPLNDAGSGKASDGKAKSMGDWIGSERTQVVGSSETTIDAKLTDFSAKQYSIVVYKSDNPADGLVACGDIGGPLVGDDLMIGLDPVDNSGDVGIASLHPDGDKTVVTLYTYVLSTDLAPASQTGSSSTMSTVDITIVGGTDGDWHFDPSTITVPAGTTVKWTNKTEVAHTIQSSDINFDDSGPLEPGASFTETFDKPGTFSYSCGPHPWMTGTITVE
jgi:plastocyanin